MTGLQRTLRHISTVLFVISGGGLLLRFSYLFCGVIWGESYFSYQPDIDTSFSADFTEAKFDRIRPGMDSAAVVRILGLPLSTQEAGPCNCKSCECATIKPFTIWHYSTDGKCWWFDFAWLGREVWFGSNKRVERINTPIHYD
jgi:hypothetical protein